MTRNFSEYTDIFFWDFKRMDNVNYNFGILEELFRLKSQKPAKIILNKPIIIIIAAIIECILYDFVRRVAQHRQEVIPGLDEKAIDDTRNKIVDQFEPIIAHVRKHNLLCVSHSEEVYINLDNLRKLRNRIHIQNRQEQLDKDEYKIWSNDNVDLACKLIEKVCEVLCTVYPRPNKNLLPFMDFPRPWAFS